MADSSAGFGGTLTLHVNGLEHEVPAEFAAWLRSIGHDAQRLGALFQTNLHIHHFRPDPQGEHIAGEHFGDATHPLAGEPHTLLDSRALGSGLVTNLGVAFLANGVNFMTAATPFQYLDVFRYHAIGTGTTAAAASDYGLQTPIAAGSLTGSTNGYMTDTQTAPAAASPSTWKSVSTFTANASLAVTEWGLFMSNAASFSGTATATSATSLTNSGASFTNTGNKLAGWVIEANASAINTPTTTVVGLVAVNAGNSGTVLNLSSIGWQTLAAASAATPGSTTAYVVYPCMWDHKVFSAINLVAADTLQTTYTCAINSGG